MVRTTPTLINPSGMATRRVATVTVDIHYEDDLSGDRETYRISINRGLKRRGTTLGQMKTEVDMWKVKALKELREIDG